METDAAAKDLRPDTTAVCLRQGEVYGTWVILKLPKPAQASKQHLPIRPERITESNSWAAGSFCWCRWYEGHLISDCYLYDNPTGSLYAFPGGMRFSESDLGVVKEVVHLLGRCRSCNTKLYDYRNKPPVNKRTFRECDLQRTYRGWRYCPPWAFLRPPALQRQPLCTTQ